MKLKKLFYISIILFLFIVSCKSNNKFLNKVNENNNKYNKYSDEYKNFLYINYDLNFTIEFDGDWIIITDYDHFNEFQKKYSRYFATDYGEVLFIGFNDNDTLGVRCTCEKLGLDNDEYLEKIKNVSNKEKNDYNISYIFEDEITLKNIAAYNFIFSTELNHNNKFNFDSIIYKSKNNNFRLEFWTNSESYGEKKEYINKIYNSVDFGLDNINKIENNNPEDNNNNTNKEE